MLRAASVKPPPAFSWSDQRSCRHGSAPLKPNVPRATGVRGQPLAAGGASTEEPW